MLTNVKPYRKLAYTVDTREHRTPWQRAVLVSLVT